MHGMQAGAGRANKDGIFTTDDPVKAYASYADHVFEDGSLGSVIPLTSGAGYAYQDGSLGAIAYEAAAGVGRVLPLQSGAAYAYQDGSLGSVPEQSGQGRSFRDGIFTTDDAAIAYQQLNQQAYADGSLGAIAYEAAAGVGRVLPMRSGAGYAFQDGSLGAVAALQTGPAYAYQDGSLGDDMLLPAKMVSAITPGPSTILSAMSPTTKAIVFAGVGVLALGVSVVAYKALKKKK